jgi:putative colanic acid biosynthesis UDP-glucose lipid carrier transferase
MTLLRAWDALLGVASFIGLSVLLKSNLVLIWEAAILIFLLAMICFHAVGLYRSWRFSSFQYELSQIFFGCFVLYAVLFLVGYLFKVSHEFSRNAVVTWMVIWPVVMATERIILRTVLRQYRRKGRNIRRAVIAGVGRIGEQLAHVITENPWSGTYLMGFFDDKAKGTVGGYPILGDLRALPEYAKNQDIDIVYLALSLQTEQKIHSLLRELADSTVSVFFIPDLFLRDLILGGSLTYFENLPVVTLRDSPIRGINALLKRLEDLALAGLFLLLVSPVFLAIALGIKLTSRGPILFKQWRYGLNGQPIRVYKFRTLNVCEDGYNFNQVSKDDPRLTRFGAFLRGTSLDELPQFINVIQGRMSLVGPRPHPVAMNEQYRKLVPGYMLRHKVKPGITGLAQVRGFRGETDTLDKIEKRVECDLEYLRQWSPLLDLKILAQTFVSAWWTNAY